MFALASYPNSCRAALPQPGRRGERCDGRAPRPSGLRMAPTAHTGPQHPQAQRGVGERHVRRSPPAKPAGAEARAAGGRSSLPSHHTALPRRCPLTSEASLVQLQGPFQGRLRKGRPHEGTAGSRGTAPRSRAAPVGNSSSTPSAFPRSRKNRDSRGACGDPLQLLSVGRC